MTQNQIKEAISRNYIELIVNQIGHKLVPIPADHSVDFEIREVVTRIVNQKTRYSDSGRMVDIQIKSTTESKISFSDGFLKYKCESKTYNDLIHRRDDINPLYLIVFILPDDKNSWVGHTKDFVTVSKNAFWYLPPLNAAETQNSSNITIEISENNLIDFNTFPNIFNDIYS